MNFFDYDFNVEKVVFACKVLAGTGEPIHKNRPSHGLAINLKGEKIYTFDSGKSFFVKENDIIFLPKNSNYVVKTPKIGDCYAINFEIDENISFEPFVCHIKNQSQITDAFYACEKAFRTKKNGYMFKCKAELYKIIYELVKEHNLGYASDKQKNKLFPAIEYIHNFYLEKELKIDFLSELCGIKSAYFRRIFIRCYGKSPIKYINDLKLSFAKELLLQKEYSVENIAMLSGFCNVYYFCRFFKKCVGMTPTEFKNSEKT